MGQLGSVFGDLCYAQLGVFGGRGAPLVGCRAWPGCWCGGGCCSLPGWGKGLQSHWGGGGSVSQGTVTLLPWVWAEQGHMPGCPALGGFRAGWRRCGTGVRSVAGTCGRWGPAQKHPGPSQCPADSRFITPVPAPADAQGLFSAFLASAALPWLSKPASAPELL